MHIFYILNSYEQKVNYLLKYLYCIIVCNLSRPARIGYIVYLRESRNYARVTQMTWQWHTCRGCGWREVIANLKLGKPEGCSRGPHTAEFGVCGVCSRRGVGDGEASMTSHGCVRWCLLWPDPAGHSDRCVR